jgi:hypothetical protein
MAPQVGVERTIISNQPIYEVEEWRIQAADCGATNRFSQKWR